MHENFQDYYSVQVHEDKREELVKEAESEAVKKNREASTVRYLGKILTPNL